MLLTAAAALADQPDEAAQEEDHAPSMSWYRSLIG
jgi:hypothetical protein